MQNGDPREPADVARRLKALLELAQIGRTRPVDDVLLAVAEAARDAVGFRAVVVNVYRPARHDYEARIVFGDPAVVDALKGTANGYDQIQALLVDRFRRVPGAYFLPAGEPVWEAMDNTHTPEDPGHGAPGDWQAEDGLLITLRSTDGAPLGVVSVDEPAAGRRPTEGDLQMLVAVCGHAALALETAQVRERALAHRRALGEILGFARGLTPGATAEEVLDRACATAAGGIGFGASAALWRNGNRFTTIARRGRPLTGLPSSFDDQDFDEDGCLVIDSDEPSELGGVGPLAWGNALLCVAMREAGGELLGVLVCDDPADGLLPDVQRRQELYLLADQAVAALGIVTREGRLAYFANHDPLTGLRNRRDLAATIEELAAADDGVGILFCDLDRFKAVNDRFGHEIGDRVIERFAGLLRGYADDDPDLAVRLGGEELCLLLPGVSRADAGAVAERIRRETPTVVADLVPSQTVSIGLALSSPGSKNPSELLAAADAALFAAKASGRDRWHFAGGPPPSLHEVARPES